MFNDRLLTEIPTTEVSIKINDEYLKVIENRIIELIDKYPELEQNMIIQARKDLLQAERTAMGDAARRGLISEEIYHELIKETDNRAVALDMIQDAMGRQIDE